MYWSPLSEPSVDPHDVAAVLRSIVEKTEPCLDLVVFWDAFGHPFGLPELASIVDRPAKVGLDNECVAAAVAAEGGFVAEGVVAASV
jgi:hypothetical protein